MVDSEQVLMVLEDAREHVRKSWGSKNLNVSMALGGGGMCASIAICTAANDLLGHHGDIAEMTAEAAHVALLEAIGQTAPSEDPCGDVYEFNDAQLSRVPVLAAFDRAIRTLKPEPTPNVDQHPAMPLDEIQSVASAELFYAAQDCARTCDLGVKLERA